MKNKYCFYIYFRSVKVNEEYSFSYELTKKCKIFIKLQVHGIKYVGCILYFSILVVMCLHVFFPYFAKVVLLLDK